MTRPPPSLLRNILALYSIQGLQYLIPLISLPWLVHSLGPESYGLLNLAMTFGTYLQMVGDYGFGLSATRKIAMLRSDPKALSRLVSSILLAKVLLAAIALAVATLVVWIIPSFREHWKLILLGCTGSLAMTFFPTWLFQGMERMVGMAQLSIVTKALQLFLWLFLVHRPEHLERTLLVNLGIAILGTASAWIAARRAFGIRFQPTAFRNAIAELRDGVEIFLSMAGAASFTNSSVLILGTFASPKELGLYCIAEKIVRAAINLGVPIGTALFPRVGGLFRESPALAIGYLRRVTPRVGLFFVGISAGLALLAPLAARLVHVPSTDIPEVILLIRIMAPLPFTIFLDNIFGTQVLLNLDRRHLFMAGTIGAGFIGVTLQFLLIPHHASVGAASSLLVSGLWTLFFFAWHAHRHAGFPGRQATSSSVAP